MTTYNVIAASEGRYPWGDEPRPCPACGGTGDAFDRELDDWADPPRPCLNCNGCGEVCG